MCPAAAGGGALGKNHAFCPKQRWAGQEPGFSASYYLDCHRYRLAAADAERGNASPAAAASQRVQEGREDACAGGADRMTECACAAVDVDARMIDVDLAHGSPGDGGECLVDLIKVGVVRLPAEPVQYLADGAYRGRGEPLRLLGMARLRQDAGDRLQAACGRGLGASEHECRRAVGDRGGAGGRHGAVLAEGGLERRDPADVAGARGLIAGDDRLAFAALDGHGGDFRVELARVHRPQRAAHRLCGESILVLPAEVILARGRIGEAAHELAIEGALQPVVEHVVEHLAVTQAITAARLGQEVGRIRHGLEAAGEHQARTAGADLVGGHHHGLQPRAAHLVDGGGGDGERDPGREGRLAGRRLAEAGRQYAAEDHFLHVRAPDAGGLDGGRGRGGAELRRRYRREDTLERADRGAPGREDDDFGLRHVGSSLETSERGFRPLSNTAMKASAISPPVMDWLSRYQWAIQLSAPARANAVILGSQGWIERSWMPSRSSRRMP